MIWSRGISSTLTLALCACSNLGKSGVIGSVPSVNHVPKVRVTGAPTEGLLSVLGVGFVGDWLDIEVGAVASALLGAAVGPALLVAGGVDWQPSSVTIATVLSAPVCKKVRRVRRRSFTRCLLGSCRGVPITWEGGLRAWA